MKSSEGDTKFFTFHFTSLATTETELLQLRCVQIKCGSSSPGLKNAESPSASTASGCRQETEGAALDTQSCFLKEN